MKIKKITSAVMESKRKATTDLNHENWDREEEPEEKGSFQSAPEDVLKNRVIKKAKRNLTTTESGASKSVFSGFSGLSNVSTLSAGGSPFSFLSKMTPTPPSPAGTPAPSKEASSLGQQDKKTENKFGFEKSSTYYSKLTSLNKAVSDWIKSHVDKNPLCILSPIFKDYEKYLKEIQEEQPESTITSTASSTIEKLEAGSKSTAAVNEKSGEKLAVPKFSFGAVNSTTDNKAALKSGSIVFGNASVTKKENVLGSFSFKPAPPVEASSSKSSIFSSASSTSVETSAAASAATSAASSATGFSFSTGKPFTFGSSIVAKPSTESVETKESEEAEDEEPPKVEFTPVVEEDHVYSKRCKVFIKSEGNYSDRGIGTLYLKPVADKDKTQLIVRADTNLGNILLNFILNESIPAQRMGKNNVMMICIPTPESGPKPTSILLRVKTGEEADEVLNTIEKYKK